jgi:hypothetical protein
VIVPADATDSRRPATVTAKAPTPTTRQ